MKVITLKTRRDCRVSDRWRVHRDRPDRGTPRLLTERAGFLGVVLDHPGRVNRHDGHPLPSLPSGAIARCAADDGTAQDAFRHLHWPALAGGDDVVSAGRECLSMGSCATHLVVGRGDVLRRVGAIRVRAVSEQLGDGGRGDPRISRLRRRARNSVCEDDRTVG